MVLGLPNNFEKKSQEGKIVEKTLLAPTFKL